ncbi:hypothetical protein BLOT_002231 [Blomia tropicalis]|nr:hypothetical protein BLOT_002231 [Blomia tropicalis]
MNQDAQCTMELAKYRKMVEIADVVDGDGYKRQPTNDTMRLYNSTIMSEWDKDRIDWQNTMNIVKHLVHSKMMATEPDTN